MMVLDACSSKISAEMTVLEVRGNARELGPGRKDWGVAILIESMMVQ